MYCIELIDNTLIFEGSYFDEGLFNFMKSGKNMTCHNRRMSTYINALAEAGLMVERLVEDTDSSVLSRDIEFSSEYYALSKAKMFPLSFIIKARKYNKISYQ